MLHAILIGLFLSSLFIHVRILGPFATLYKEPFQTNRTAHVNIMPIWTNKTVWYKLNVHIKYNQSSEKKHAI